MTSTLNTLKSNSGSRKKKLRKGRGIAAGQGASCGFGMRGQKSRSGRPMSGDLAPTTSRDTVKLFEKIGSDLPPGLIQLAGGTNEKTHEFLNSNNLPDGIAFGSAARKIMQPFIEFAHKNNKKLYEYPEFMALAIKKAQKFLEPWKSSSIK